MNSQNPIKLIDGKAAAARVLAEVREDVHALKAAGIVPALAVVLVGSDPASQVYVRNKVLRAGEVGIRSLEYRLGAEASAAEVLSAPASTLSRMDTLSAPTTSPSTTLRANRKRAVGSRKTRVTA